MPLDFVQMNASKVSPLALFSTSGSRDAVSVQPHSPHIDMDQMNSNESNSNKIAKSIQIKLQNESLLSVRILDQ